MSFAFGKYLNGCKICILGANGRIGRHLALNLKLNQNVTELSLYGINNTSFLKEDLSHIDSKTRVSAFYGGEKALLDSLKCSNLVVIAAGLPRSEKIKTREALFHANAGLMLKFMKAITMSCPRDMPFIYLVTNPVNTLVPLCGEYLKDTGAFNPRKLIGSSGVDQMRARTFLGQLVNYDPSKIMVPVVGGHSVDSITPLISQSKPSFELSVVEQQQLAQRIINGGTEVTKASKSGGSAFLSMAYCIGRFCNSVCRAVQGDRNVVEVGYVPADVNECEYFSCNFSLNADGVQECHRLPPMSPCEIKRYYKAVDNIQKNIYKAKNFYKKYKLKRS